MTTLNDKQAAKALNAVWTDEATTLLCDAKCRKRAAKPAFGGALNA
ncbi:MAG: hypothetical protein IPN94_02765 [Sphingobacteriales bacterium]|nr:hypothetical protein [Sphingobacteriales bacterium]